MKKKEFEFLECLKNGKEGEIQVIKYLYNNYGYNWYFNYVGDSIEYQKKDIDLLMINKNTNDIISIEIKTDFTPYDNIFAEFLSSEEFKTPGCFIKTDADYILYYFVKKGKIYILPVLQIKELMNISNWKIGKAFDKVNTKKGLVRKTSLGYLIPIKDILKTIKLKNSIFNNCEVIL